MAAPDARPTYRTLEEVATEVENILVRTVQDIKTAASGTKDTRQQLTWDALVAAREKTIFALRRYRASGTSSSDRRYAQYASIFEVSTRIEPIEGASDFDEAVGRVMACDAALLEALDASTAGDTKDDEAGQALVDLVAEMRRATTRVLNSAESL